MRKTQFFGFGGASLCTRIALVIFLCMPLPGIAQGRLLSPWDDGAVATQAAKQVAGACETPPELPKDLHAVPYYSDAEHRSKVDKRKLEQVQRSTQGFRKAAEDVVALADRYQLHRDVPAGYCAEKLLVALAEDGALAGKMSGRQANFVQGWLLNAYATAWLKVRGSHAFDPAEVAKIEQWLGVMGQSVKQFYVERGSTNNLLYWGGLAAVSAGIATNDRELFEWGVECYKRGLKEIQPDGTLPAEMGRGMRALNYHAYAATPLVMIAELASYNGMDLYDLDNKALGRLVKVTADGMRDPTEFNKKAGVKQKRFGEDGAQVIWLRLYVKHSHLQGYDDLLSKYTRSSHLYLGGTYSVN